LLKEANFRNAFKCDCNVNSYSIVADNDTVSILFFKLSWNIQFKSIKTHLKVEMYSKISFTKIGLCSFSPWWRKGSAQYNWNAAGREHTWFLL